METIWSILIRALSFGVFAGVGVAIYRFYRRHLFEVELHIGSDDTFCFVLPSERKEEKEKTFYFAQIKASAQIFTGAGLGLEDAYLVLRDHMRYAVAEFSEPAASANVREFFNSYGKEWKEAESNSDNKKEGSFGKCFSLVAKGVVRGEKSFSDFPSGNYRVFLIFETKRFEVVLPCMFASSGGAEHSTICGEIKVRRKVGQRLDPINLAKSVQVVERDLAGVFRIRIVILDFDFLPWVTWFKVLRIKEERVP